MDKEKRVKETETIRSTMQGFVSAEKQKFERLASKMKTKEKDLAIKNEKLRQVEELIKNSPCVSMRSSRYPLRDKNESQSCDESVRKLKKREEKKFLIPQISCRVLLQQLPQLQQPQRCPQPSPCVATRLLAAVASGRSPRTGWSTSHRAT